jgi:hypothetical protein
MSPDYQVMDHCIYLRPKPSGEMAQKYIVLYDTRVDTLAYFGRYGPMLKFHLHTMTTCIPSRLFPLCTLVAIRPESEIEIRLQDFGL